MEFVFFVIVSKLQNAAEFSIEACCRLVVHGASGPLVECRRHLTRRSGNYLDVPVKTMIETELNDIAEVGTEFVITPVYQHGGGQCDSFSGILVLLLGKGLGMIVHWCLSSTTWRRLVDGKSVVKRGLSEVSIQALYDGTVSRLAGQLR